jgi:hypothetical protein
MLRLGDGCRRVFVQKAQDFVDRLPGCALLRTQNLERALAESGPLVIVLQKL